MTISVITVSDRAAKGIYEDLTGPAVEMILARGIENAVVDRTVVPDEPAALRVALENAHAAGAEVILTAGGTGLGPRDITPEAVADWGTRSVPGVSEYLRIRSLEQTERAALSRGIAVQKERTLAITLPGSVKGASFCAEILVRLLPHAVAMIAGEGHES